MKVLARASAALAIALLASHGIAADQTILGTTFLVKDPGDALKRKVVAVAKEKASANTIVGDPAGGSPAGAILTLIANGGSPSAQTIGLPQGTSSTGKPFWAATSNGFAYKDSKGDQGPVKLLKIQRSPSGDFLLKLVALGKNGALSVVPPDPGTEAWVTLDLPSGDRYCAQFGPESVIKNDGAVLFKATKPTVEGCPPPPTTTTTSSTTSTTTTSESTTTSTTTTSTTTTTTTTTTSTTTSTSTSTTTTTTTSTTTTTTLYPRVVDLTVGTNYTSAASFPANTRQQITIPAGGAWIKQLEVGHLTGVGALTIRTNESGIGVLGTPIAGLSETDPGVVVTASVVSAGGAGSSPTTSNVRRVVYTTPVFLAAGTYQVSMATTGNARIKVGAGAEPSVPSGYVFWIVVYGNP